jgi:hypothetical protein
MADVYAVVVTAPPNNPGIFSLPKTISETCMLAIQLLSSDDATVTKALILKYTCFQHAKDAMSAIKDRALCIQDAYKQEVGRAAITTFPSWCELPVYDESQVLSTAWTAPLILPGGMAWADGYAFVNSRLSIMHSFVAQTKEGVTSIAPMSLCNYFPDDMVAASTYSSQIRAVAPKRLTASTSAHVLNSDRNVPGIVVIPGSQQNKSLLMAARCIVTGSKAKGLPLQTGLLQAWDTKKLGIRWTSQYVVHYDVFGKDIKLTGRVKSGIAITLPDVNFKLEAIRRMKIQYARVCRSMRLYLLSRPELKHMVNYTGDEETKEYDALGVDEEESDTDEGEGIKTFKNSKKGSKYVKSVATLTRNLLDHMDNSTPAVMLTGGACVAAKIAAEERPLKRARTEAPSPEARAADMFWAAFELSSDGGLKVRVSAEAAVSAVNHVGEYLSASITQPEQLERSSLAKSLLLLQQTAGIPSAVRLAAFEFIEPVV